MKEQTDYQPIDCNYYDELVLLAMRKKPCEIVYQAGEQKITAMTGIIRDIYTKNKEEFIVLESGLTIRLDKLISADGKKVENGACRIKNEK